MKAQPWQLDPSHYDFSITLSPMYSHLDTERHVNNVAVQSLHSEVRVRFLMAVLGNDSWFSDHLLLRPRRTVTQFTGETHYGRDVLCAARVVAVEEDRFRLALGLFQDGRCVGVQECLMGAWGDEAWVALPASVREALTGRLGAEVVVADWPQSGSEEYSARIHDYPSRSPLTMRYADLDPDRCLGELSVARYTEQARAGSMDVIRMPGLSLLVARIDLRYHRWDKGFGDITLASGVAGIGNTSFVLRGGVLMDDDLVATSESIMVLMDQASHRPTPVTDTMRAKMADISV
ncbi:hypothetical protein CEK62_15285 [Alcanivorax sp. N3-2A]|nr:hypothetical protein CEK62_15285 [Alcanivorax sp. N3-2A]